MEIRFDKRELTILSATFIITSGIFASSWVMTRNPDITPDSARHGWSADAFEEAAPLIAQMPGFEITDENGIRIVQDNRNANIRLWEAVLAVNGEHLPNVPQQVGDCVSHAYCHAGEFLICIEMTTGPPGKEFHRLFPPYVYGTSRHQIGRDRIRGDGSCMAWAVKAGQEYGVLRADADGVPPYSGSIARKWGHEGPPQSLIESSKMYTIGMASPVHTAVEVRDAICNGYPVPFGAGGIGFDRVIVKYGRLVADPPSGQWSHAQCVVGFDGSGSEPLYCILNSWGPLAGGRAPMDGSPPGSYWITEKSMEKIARQGDTYAISGFAGFKSRSLDFKIFGSKSKERNDEKNHHRHAGGTRDAGTRSRTSAI